MMSDKKEQSLRATYAAMAKGEIERRLDQGELVPMAAVIARAELSRRQAGRKGNEHTAVTRRISLGGVLAVVVFLAVAGFLGYLFLSPWILILWAIMGVVGLLSAIARRSPLLGLLLGVGLCSVPVLIWNGTSPNNFRSDGSAAGVAVMVALGVVGIVAFGIGGSTIGTSLNALRGDSGAADASHIGKTDAPDLSGVEDSAADATPSPPPGSWKPWHGWVLGAFGLAVGWYSFRLIFGMTKWRCTYKACDFEQKIYALGGDVGMGFFYVAFSAFLMLLSYNILNRGREKREKGPGTFTHLSSLTTPPHSESVSDTRQD